MRRKTAVSHCVLAVIKSTCVVHNAAGHVKPAALQAHTQANKPPDGRRSDEGETQGGGYVRERETQQGAPCGSVAAELCTAAVELLRTRVNRK